MDIRCVVCGEPWDIYELHDVPGMTYSEARKAFRTMGCAIFATSHNDTVADPALAELADMMGDDIDGLAAMTEDLFD